MGSMIVSPNAGVMNGSASPFVAGKIRSLRNPLFDTLVAASGDAIVPGGQKKLFLDVSGKDKEPWLTNMEASGEIPGINFTCTGLRIMFHGCAAVDIANFFMSNTVRLYIGANVAYCDAPADWWQGGGGITGEPNNGIESPQAVMLFDPISLAGTRFNVSIIGDAGAPTATAAFFARFYLQGIGDAPAQ
jgi:hypothetical protein